MPEMAVVIYCDPAHIDPRPRGVERDESFLRAAEAVVDFQHGIERVVSVSHRAGDKDPDVMIAQQIEISGGDLGAAAGEKSDKIEEIPARG